MKNNIKKAFWFIRGAGLPIPTPSDALFHLDGTVIEISSSFYFKDRTTNGRNFLITGKDFTTTGFPYKSSATISAPAGDTTLIAADVNGFLYTAGTPNQIPVVSLFQNIEYENKLFTRHAAQTLNAGGFETYEPRVLDIVLYSSARTGADLTTCQTYYSVPTEDTTTMAWLSPTGNDTTGDGSKANPYLTLDKIKASTKVNIYLKTGAYPMASSLTFTGATQLNIIGTGFSSFSTWTTSLGCTLNRHMTFTGCIITCPSSNYAFYHIRILSFDKCKITKTDGLAACLGDTGVTTFSVTNCVLNTNVSSGLVLMNRVFSAITISGNYGTFKTNIPISTVQTLLTVKWNKATGTSTPIMEAAALVWKDNLGFTNPQIRSSVTECVIEDETIAYSMVLNGNITFQDNVMTGNITSTAGVAGPTNILRNTITGSVTVTTKANAHYYDNVITAPSSVIPCSIYAAAGANITGVEVLRNRITGSWDQKYMLYLGDNAYNEITSNTINGAKIENNYIENLFVGAGTCHTLGVFSGINYSIRWNEIISTQGYGIVLKSGGVNYNTTDIHVGYNIFRFSAQAIVCVYFRTTGTGIIVSNNVVIGANASTAVFAVDVDATMLMINNLIKLGANATILSGAGMTSRNNSINENGFTATTPGGSNTITTTAITSGGVPASKIGSGESVAGTENDTGLASNYVIPTAITYRDQDGIDWQRGAVILP
jgi:hypothetical protein